MSPSRRMCDLARFTSDAKSVLREVEMDRHREEFEALLARAREDPLIPYRKKRWYPRFVVWELTLACNMRCKHCGSSAGKPRPDELSLEEMLGVCDDLGALGCERITLLGGEPLIHPHWERVAARIREDGYRANVITNGWTLSKPEVCDRIRAAELSIVGVSVDGLERSHDELRNREGSFGRIMQGLDLLAEREVSVAVATVVTNDSLRDLEGLYRVLCDKGVKVWQLQVGNPLGRLDRDNPLLIKPGQLRALLAFIEDYQGAHDGMRVDVSDNVGYYGEFEERGIRQKQPGLGPYWTGCHAGIQAMGLDSNGDVKGCQSLPSEPPYIAGNLRERPLAEIWNDPEAFPFTRGFSMEMLQGFCARCRYGPVCKAGCTSAALAHSGSVGDNPMCFYRAEQTERAGPEA